MAYFEEDQTESDIIFTQTYEVFKTGSDNVFFYKDLFASLCFIFFGLALALNDAYFYFGAMMCACISTTAHRKKWPDPLWATLMMEDLNARFDSLKRRHFPKKEFSKEDDIGPLPPLGE
ncbi:MAG: hypothetical protein M0Q12_08130 [Synergistaceae bacterium]|jgi:hypothetical protein|nr:hypothetical protein [Synergistaceae bacterium]